MYHLGEQFITHVRSENDILKGSHCKRTSAPAWLKAAEQDITHRRLTFMSIIENFYSRKHYKVTSKAKLSEHKRIKKLGNMNVHIQEDIQHLIYSVV